MTFDRTTTLYAAGIGLIVAILCVASLYLVLTRMHDARVEPPRDHLIGDVDTAAYTDLEGRPISLSQYLGNILVVRSWASWCPSCAQELPELSRMAEEFNGRGVVVVAINRAEPLSTVTAFLSYIGNPGGFAIILDPTDYFYRSSGGYSMPETQIYDRAGKLVTHHRGSMAAEDMRTLIENAVSYE